MSADNPITLQQERKLMDQPIITIEQLRNLNIKCLNASKQHNKIQSIHNGNSTAQLKGKNSTTMQIQENPAGSYLQKQKNISYENKQKEKKPNNKMGIYPHNIKYQAKHKKIKRSFLALLKQKGININTKWQTCMKICEEDNRWNLLKISDKKKYFNEYIGELKKISDMEKKAKTEVSKAQFIKMLKQCKTLTSDAKMHRVSFDFMTDPRWRLLQGKQRQDAFQQYMDQLYQKEKQNQKQRRHLNIENLKKCLQQDPSIKYTTRWDSFIKMYTDNPFYRQLHQYDRISTFVDYIIFLQKKNDDEMIKENKLRERINRINLRKLIREKLCSGQITYKTKWKTFVKEFKQNSDLLNMMDPNQQGTSAHQIFEYLMDQVRQNHKKIKTDIKHHFKKKIFKMTEETTNQQFNNKLQDLENYEKLNPMLKDYFYCYFRQKIKSKNAYRKEILKKNAKKEKKAIFKIFKQMKEIKNKYTLDEQQLQKIQKYLEELGIQMTRENIFSYRLQFLEEDANDEDKRKRKDKEQSHSDSDSESVHKRKKKKQQEIDKGKRHHSSFRENIDNDYEEQGQIKDQEQEIQKKKKPKKSKRKNSSSSDSD